MQVGKNPYLPCPSVQKKSRIEKSLLIKELLALCTQDHVQRGEPESCSKVKEHGDTLLESESHGEAHCMARAPT